MRPPAHSQGDYHLLRDGVGLADLVLPVAFL